MFRSEKRLITTVFLIICFKSCDTSICWKTAKKHSKSANSVRGHPLLFYTFSSFLEHFLRWNTKIAEETLGCFGVKNDSSLLFSWLFASKVVTHQFVGKVGKTPPTLQIVSTFGENVEVANHFRKVRLPRFLPWASSQSSDFLLLTTGKVFRNMYMFTWHAGEVCEKLQTSCLKYALRDSRIERPPEATENEKSMFLFSRAQLFK